MSQDNQQEYGDYELRLDGMDDRPIVKELLKNLKTNLPQLEELLEGCSGDRGYDDRVYRFYHQSFKVYIVQDQTMKIVAKLTDLLPDAPLNEWFLQIIREGTGKEFDRKDNKHWLEVTRPMLEAFFHARFFLEMAVKFGKELKSPPRLLPNGWAAFLYLYNLR